ncbi:MAG TPA: hypothetical protein PLZ43_14455 [bacterium]|nr:hypothetical protein [bacterium]
MNYAEILSYGMPGLGFLLALFTFGLIKLEQKKSRPRKSILIAIYVFMGFAIIIFVMGTYLKALELMNTGTASACPEAENCGKYVDEIETFKAASLSKSDLMLISSEYFDKQHSKDDFCATIHKLIEVDRNMKSYEKHFEFQIFKIFKTLSDSDRSSINTNRNDKGQEEVYETIYNLLRDLGYAGSEYDGELSSLRKAVVDFQRDINSQTPGYFPDTQLGFFGKSSIDAVRNLYNLQNK